MSAAALRHIGESSVTFVVDELLDGTTGYANGPERALMSALLFDGVQAYMCYVLSDGTKKGSRYREAFTWVNTKGKEYVFSFDSVCEGLGIDPEFLRFGLANASNSQREALSKSRRHF